MFSFCINALAADLEYFPSPRAASPFSEAARVGDLIFLSGRIGFVDGKLPEDIQAEARAAMESIKTSVEKYGSSMDRVAKCTVFLADMDDYARVNEVYLSFFKKNKPARSAVEVSALAAGASLEIECIAAAND